MLAGLRALLIPVGLLAPPGTAVGETKADAPEATESEAATPGPREPGPPAASQAEDEPEPKAVVPTGGSVAGSTIDPDDPNRGRAESDLEGESLDRTNASLPERLPPLQRAGWWSTFGAVSLGLGAGIFAGLAERQEDELDRLTFGVDLATGARFRYDEYSETYEAMVQRGTTHMWISRALLIAGGMSLAAGITLFALDGKKRRGEATARQRPRLRIGAGAAEVTF